MATKILILILSEFVYNYKINYMPEKITENTLIGDILHKWTIQEYEQHDRGMIWYVVMILLGLGLVIYGIISGNFLFSLIIVLVAIILFLQSHQVPPQVLFQITELGIILGNRFYSYSEFSSFYLIYQPPEVKTLFLETKSALRPLISIPLLDMDPMEIKFSLKEFLIEDTEKEDEPISDRMARNWQIH
ncbi:MAG TPA: hypothetical protein DEB09_03460 [Candidatus Magasanikbacteria bacterium]|nr:hypothetical protein [Candidatus Magasanikbacteria bacterium]